MSAISWRELRKKATQNPAKVVLADGQDPRVVEAAVRAEQAGYAHPILIGPHQVIQPLWEKYGSRSESPSIDPADLPPSERDPFVDELLKLPKFRHLSRAEASARLRDSLVFGCLYLKRGLAEGFVGGATRTTTDTLRAVMSIIGLAPSATRFFGFFLIENRGASNIQNPLVLMADCAVCPDPSPKQLAHIAVQSAAAYESIIGEKAKVVFLSFSTHGSAEHTRVDKVRRATALARELAPSLSLEGEWQADAALDLDTARMKGVGDSPLAGQANVLIVPDLSCGNIAYKLVQRMGGCRAVGPVLWGTALPANDLSRGCVVEDVMDMMALTTLQVRQNSSLERVAYCS
jgi:phosphate acetyltransferase